MEVSGLSADAIRVPMRVAAAGYCGRFTSMVPTGAWSGRAASAMACRRYGCRRCPNRSRSRVAALPTAVVRSMTITGTIGSRDEVVMSSIFGSPMAAERFGMQGVSHVGRHSFADRIIYVGFAFIETRRHIELY